MKTSILTKSVFPLLAGIFSGILFYLLFHYLYLEGILSYDVSDGHGHGPDQGGTEWQHAFLVGIQRQSLFWGLLFGLASALAGTCILRKKKS